MRFMINSAYTNAVSSIRATDTFKSRVTEAMENAREQEGAEREKRKARPIVKWTAAAAVLVFALWFGIWGGPWLYEMIQPRSGGPECCPPYTEVRENMIFYNGKLFYFGYDEEANVDIKDILDDPENGFSVVGTVQNVSFDVVPSAEFQSNIYGSSGCKVYASEKTPDIIIIEFSDETLYGMRYMELRAR